MKQTPETIGKRRQSLLKLYKNNPEQFEKHRKIRLGKKSSTETQEKQRLAHLGKIVSDETREKQRLAKLGKKLSPEHIEKFKKIRSKRYEDPLEREKQSKLMKIVCNTPEMRVKKSKVAKICLSSPEVKKKLRKAAIERCNKNNGGVCVSYNSKACEFFKSFDEEHNTKGRYAVYGNGEFLIPDLYYYPDYINFDLKLIMEWDEENHYDVDGNLIQKDIQRQKEIQEHYPEFEFIRIREKDFVKTEHECSKSYEPPCQNNKCELLERKSRRRHI
jgi:hypothetical protein